MSAILRVDGRRMCVVRPSATHTAFALRLAQKAMRKQDQALLARLPAEVEKAGGTYRFVGFACADGEGPILDSNGTGIDRMRPGDSYVTLEHDEYLVIGEPVRMSEPR